MKKNLILEEIKRMNYVMNYDLDKTSKENHNKNENLIFESKFKESLISKIESMVLSEDQKNNPPKKTPAKPTTNKTTSNTAKSQDNKLAQQIFNELKYAFDGAGTYENEAVAAFNKIKNKPTLDRINQLVKARNMSGINSLYDWLKDEMSDYDYEQYRKIWNKLKTIDSSVVAPKVNNAMRAASVVGDVTGVNAAVAAGESVAQAIQKLNKLTISDIMEGFRGFLNGAAGGVVQILLTVFGGPIGAGINLFAWGAVFIWDIYQWINGSPNWWNLILDLFAVVTAGVAAKTLGAANAAGSQAGKQGLKPLMSTLKSKFPTIFKYISSFGQKLTGLGASAVKSVKSTLGWLSNKLPFFKNTWNTLNGAVSKISNLISSVDEAITSAAGGAVFKFTKNQLNGVITKAFPKFGNFIKSPKGVELMSSLSDQEAKLIDDWIAGPVKGKTSTFAQEYACKNGSKNTCELFKQGNDYYQKTIAYSKPVKSGSDVKASVKNKATNLEKIQKTQAHTSDVQSATEA